MYGIIAQKVNETYFWCCLLPAPIHSPFLREFSCGLLFDISGCHIHEYLSTHTLLNIFTEIFWIQPYCAAFAAV